MVADWKELSLADAVLINPDVRINRGEVYPFIDMQAIVPNRKYVIPSQERKFNGSGSCFVKGDTLMARITPCLENGKIAQFSWGEQDSVGHGSTEFIVFRGRPGVSDSAFVFYLINSEEVRRFAISQMSGTSGRQRVPVESLKHLKIRLPSLPEQQAIAYILSTLDDKIELNRRMNETLEEIARAIFKSWFIDFDPVRAKAEGRDPGFPKPIADLFPDSFEKSQLGNIPSGWFIKPIGEVARCVGGSTPSTKEAAFWEDGVIPFITPKDMSQLGSPIILNSERAITELGAQKISSGVLPPGTVLLSSRAPIGYLAITTLPVSINQGIIALICDGLLPKSYAFGWLATNLDRIKANAGGTTFAEISKGNFRKLPAIVPTEEILTQYSLIFESSFRFIINNEKERRTLISIRDSLLPKLISGEIRVKDVEESIE